MAGSCAPTASQLHGCQIVKDELSYILIKTTLICPKLVCAVEGRLRLKAGPS